MFSAVLMGNNHQNCYKETRTSVNYVMECIQPENMSRLPVTTQFLQYCYNDVNIVGHYFQSS